MTAPSPLPASRFELQPLGPAGLVAVRRQRLADARGALSRLFCAEELAAAGWAGPGAPVNPTVPTRPRPVRVPYLQPPSHAALSPAAALAVSLLSLR